MFSRLAPVAVTWDELVAHVAAKNSPLPKSHYRLLRQEAQAGRVWGVRNVGGAYASETGDRADPTASTLPALFGVRPLGETIGLTWFSVLPGGLATTMVPFVRIARRVIFFEASAFAAVITQIDDLNRNGQRLGLACGFRPTELMRGTMREWRLVEHERHLGHDHRQVSEASGGARAPVAAHAAAANRRRAPAR